MTDLRQAAQQALEALEGWDNYGAWVWPESALEQSKQNTTDSIAALRKALAQTAQEPTPWRDMIVATLVREGINKHKARELADHFTAQPKQEPVAWMTINEYGEEDDIHYENPEGHLLDGWTYKPLYTHPPSVQPKPEPLEYWNAVEGWVKIEEVRDHFDSVGCGTIYKTSGEDRVPLYTAPPAAQPEQEPVKLHEAVISAWSLREVYFDEDGEPSMHRSPPAAQREWIGLTDEDWEKVANRKNTVLDTFEQGAVWAAYKLESRNT